MPTPETDGPHPPNTPGALAPLRGYLLFVAEQCLGDGPRPKAGASDLVQSALLAAHRARDQFRGDSPEQYRGWLRRILLNVVRKFRRAHRTASRAACREVPLDDQPTVRLRPGREPSPSHHARQREQREALARALDRLSPGERQVISLHLDEGRTFAEIAPLLSKTPDAVRMLYHRALKQLAGLLPGQCA